jgi:PhzF family phenazine biosynthesis protein
MSFKLKTRRKSMTRERAFKQVDVFTAVPLLGNPVAVVLDADGLSDAEMHAFANWTNLSETTFVLPPTTTGADYHVRIFTPRTELPFAGHPTLGTAHAVIEAGLAVPKNGKLIQQCAVGLVEVSVTETGLSFRLPRYSFEAAPDAEALASAMGARPKAPPMIVDVGPRWVIAELETATLVEGLTPNLAALADYDLAHHTTGLTIFAAGGEGDITVRSFAPTDGIAEDPVCGSGNAAVAAYRLKTGSLVDGDAYVASQGRQVGRDGRVSVLVEGTSNGQDIHVGGSCITCISGLATV